MYAETSVFTQFWAETFQTEMFPRFTILPGDVHRTTQHGDDVWRQLRSSLGLDHDNDDDVVVDDDDGI